VDELGELYDRLDGNAEGDNGNADAEAFAEDDENVEVANRYGVDVDYFATIPMFGEGVSELGFMWIEDLISDGVDWAWGCGTTPIVDRVKTNFDLQLGGVLLLNSVG